MDALTFIYNIYILGTVSGGADGIRHSNSALAGEARSSARIDTSWFGKVFEAIAHCLAISTARRHWIQAPNAAATCRRGVSLASLRIRHALGQRRCHLTAWDCCIWGMWWGQEEDGNGHSGDCTDVEASHCWLNWFETFRKELMWSVFGFWTSLVC